nr:MAG TPA: hypothetical protein [Caudoviricetes sp.]
MWYAEGVKRDLLAAGFLRFQFHRKSPAHLAGLSLYRGGAGAAFVAPTLQGFSPGGR